MAKRIVLRSKAPEDDGKEYYFSPNLYSLSSTKIDRTNNTIWAYRDGAIRPHYIPVKVEGNDTGVSNLKLQEELQQRDNHIAGIYKRFDEVINLIGTKKDHFVENDAFNKSFGLGVKQVLEGIVFSDNLKILQDQDAELANKVVDIYQSIDVLEQTHTKHSDTDNEHHRRLTILEQATADLIQANKGIGELTIEDDFEVF